MGVDLSFEQALWLYTRARQGSDRSHVAQVLQRKGFAQEQVDHLCGAAFDHLPDFQLALQDAQRRVIAAQEQFDEPAAVEAPAFQAVAALPESQNTWSCAHGMVQVLSRCAQPHVAVLGNVVTEAECEALIACSRDHLRRADVVDSGKGGSYVDARRTSELVMHRRAASELLARIEARIAQVTGIPVERGEGLQVMRYGPGAEYQPHFDYFRPEEPGERSLLENGGQRIASLVIYLSEVEAGGATVFPRVGLQVVPRKGNAVYFAYTDAQSACDPLSFHGGAPVLAGEKWIATKWLRESAYA